jgi:hypothetical protein
MARSSVHKLNLLTTRFAKIPNSLRSNSEIYLRSPHRAGDQFTPYDSLSHKDTTDGVSYLKNPGKIKRNLLKNKNRPGWWA